MADAAAPRSRRPELAILLVTLIWGAAFVWMKQALDAGEAWHVDRAPGAARDGTHPAAGLALVVGLFMALRFAGAALLLALVSRRARQGLDGAAWRGGLILGGLLVGGFLLQMFGLASIPSSVSAFLTSLYVLFTAASEAVIARRAPRGPLIVGALLATAGAAYIGGPPQVSFGVGEWLTVGSALVFALHIVFTDRITKRVDPVAVTLSSFLVVAGASLGVALLGLASPATPTLADVGALLSMGEFLVPLALTTVLATLVAITIMNLFQRELDPVRAAILYAVEPVWAALIALGLGMEAPNRWLFLGGGALLAGNWIAELRPFRGAR